MSSEAAYPPPPGEKSNFIDPPTIKDTIIGVLALELAISTISMLVRCYAQWYLTKRLTWADFWMLLGWAWQVVFVGFLLACIPYGAGRHMWDVRASDFAEISFLLFVDYILYGCAVLGAKMSIILQLKAIFVPRGRSLSPCARFFYWAAVSLMAINIIFYVSHNFMLIFQCQPIERGWNSDIPGTCMNQVAMLESSGPFNIISDILIFLLPMSAIWRLQLPLKTRLQIGSAFAIGLFGCVCSAVRLYYSNQLNTSHDTTYLTFQNQLWANAEITAALLITNIIILPRFIRSKRGITSSYAYNATPASRSYRISKARPMGIHQNSTSEQAFNDPYIELNDAESREYTYHPKSEGQLDHQRQQQGGTDQGILRTIQIESDSASQKLSPPPAVALNNPRAAVWSEATGNRTRLYDGYDS